MPTKSNAEAVTRICLLLAFLSQFGCVSVLGAGSYVQVSAIIQTFAYKGGNTNEIDTETIQKFSSVCTVGEYEWRIDNDLGANGLQDWFFDRTNVYFSLRQKGKSHTTVNIFPSTDGCPLGTVVVNIPWLAFCSGQYLKREGRIVPTPVAFLRAASDGFAYADKTETFNDGLGLPQTVNLVTSKVLYEASLVQSRAKMNTKLVVKLPPDGLLKFHYGVETFTNILGWNVPLTFEWTQNQPDTNDNWIPCYGGQGRVGSLRALDAIGNLFVTNQTIVDWRFQNTSQKGVGQNY